VVVRRARLSSSGSVDMSANAYDEDPRTVAELRAEWNAGPQESDPPREQPSRATKPYALPRLGEVRCALFAKLHCPESIRKPKGRQ
jgi:hypothetical protein